MLTNYSKKSKLPETNISRDEREVPQSEEGQQLHGPHWTQRGSSSSHG